MAWSLNKAGCELFWPLLNPWSVAFGRPMLQERKLSGGLDTILGSNKTLIYVLQFVLHVLRLCNFGSLACVLIWPNQGGCYLQFLISPLVVYNSCTCQLKKFFYYVNKISYKPWNSISSSPWFYDNITFD